MKWPFDVRLAFGLASASLLLIAVSIFCAPYRKWLPLFTCLVSNIVYLPVLFWTAGGIQSGIPVFFILGVFIATMLLNGKLRNITTAVSIVSFTLHIVLSFLYPEKVHLLNSIENSLSVILCFLFTSIFIAIFSFYVRFNYQSSQDKLSKINLQLKEQASNDDLTNLYNRRYLIKQIQNVLDKVDTDIYLEMFDLDDFKHVNDRFGHLYGNEVLATFANILSEEIKNNVVGRYGGEEFLAVLTDCNKEQAVSLAQQVQRRCKELLTLPDGTYVTVSVGISKFDKSMSLDDFVMQADSKMYTAKAGGKNRVAF